MLSVGMGAKGRPIMTAKTSGITAFRFILGVVGAALAIALPLSALNAQSGATKQDTAAAKKKIYFGDVAKKGAYPFMVSVIKASAKQTEAGIHAAHFCGGSLIRQRWVLTAAHCAYELDQQPPRVRKPEDINVYVGSNEFKGGQRIKVRRIIVHPKYDVEESPDNDIALLELAEAPAAGRTSIITLATPATEQEFGVPGKPVTAAGWGENEDGEFETRHRRGRHLQRQHPGVAAQSVVREPGRGAAREALAVGRDSQPDAQAARFIAAGACDHRQHDLHGEIRDPQGYLRRRQRRAVVRGGFARPLPSGRPHELLGSRLRHGRAGAVRCLYPRRAIRRLDRADRQIAPRHRC
jgi:hypothetical protein